MPLHREEATRQDHQSKRESSVHARIVGASLVPGQTRETSRSGVAFRGTAGRFTSHRSPKCGYARPAVRRQRQKRRTSGWPLLRPDGATGIGRGTEVDDAPTLACAASRPFVAADVQARPQARATVAAANVHGGIDTVGPAPLEGRVALADPGSGVADAADRRCRTGVVASAAVQSIGALVDANEGPVPSACFEAGLALASWRSAGIEATDFVGAARETARTAAGRGSRACGSRACGA